MSDAPLSLMHTESAELISGSGISFQLSLEFWFFSVFPAAHSRELSFALNRKPQNSSSSEEVPMCARHDAHEVIRNAGQISSGLTLRERRPFGLCESSVSSLGPPRPTQDSSGSFPCARSAHMEFRVVRPPMRLAPASGGSPNLTG